MPDYDFRVLSPIDFEIFVRDLLQEELGIRLESFKTGRDKGIDFRYCPSADNTLIIQCKHYVESSFDVLFSQLRKHEMLKVKKLNPSRYILAVSMGLTPTQKDNIYALFDPFIRSTGDIYGREDLNNLLQKFPKIERHTFKLWLSSMPIFEEILHSKMKNVSRDALEKIRLHAKHYVQNESFHEAIRILDKHHFCIIAGIPGIGKTILAEMLCLYFINQGYEMVKISSDISEAWSLDHAKQKRIYYYDDFLGQTSLTEKLNKNEDQELLDFIFTIRQSKVSKLILTTREYILNRARLIYEKIARENFDGETCVIDLSKYTRMNRAKILFNHIYFSELPTKYKEALLRTKNYLKIIDHNNYNPRIIDLMTQFPRVTHIAPADYFTFFKSNLENPLEIWKHAFEEQLSNAARDLLLVMVTMPSEVFLEDLQEAFQVFHRQQANEYNFQITPSDFTRALKELDGNFTISERSKEKTIIRFHNPSIRDFLEHYISLNEFVIRDLIKASIFYDQTATLWEFGECNVDTSVCRKTIKKYSSEFISALSKTLNSMTCQIVNYRTAGSSYKDRGYESFESKVILVAHVAVILKDSKMTNLLAEVLQVVENHILEGNADKSDLSLLLKELKKLRLISSKNHCRLLERAKKFLMDDFTWLDDFESFCIFTELFPNMVSGKDKQYVIEEFEDMAYSGLDYSPKGPDDYRNDADQIRTISEKLGIDMSGRVSELENEADELEQSGKYAADEHDYEYLSSRSDDYCSDQDIESIFRTLI